MSKADNVNPLRCPVCGLSMPSIPFLVPPSTLVCSAQCCVAWDDAHDDDYRPERDPYHGECRMFPEDAA